MGVTGIGIGVGIGPFDLSKPSGSALDVITSSNGAWWVTKERGKNAITASDGSGGFTVVQATWSGGVLTEDSTPAQTHTLQFRNFPQVTDGSTWTMSAEVKPNGRDWVRFTFTGTAFASQGVYFDVANGIVGTVENAPDSYSITAIGDGYYRCTVTATADETDTDGDFVVYLADADGSSVYDGDGSSGVFFRNPQFEESAAFTSYEETTGDALYGALLDHTGGGRHLLLPGGSANPVLLDHTGTDYFWFPGTTGNNLSIAGLSNSTTYDYTVTYLDTTTATGSETTDGSGNLVFGNTQTNFSVKKVTKIEVEPSGGGALVADVRATSADPDATTFAELISALTVTINRSSTGYKTAVVDQPMYVFATDDYLATSGSSAFWNIGAGEDMTAVVVLRLHNNKIGSFDRFFGNRSSALDGWAVTRQTDTANGVLLDTGSAWTDQGPAFTLGVMTEAAIVVDRTAAELEAVADGVASGSPTDISAAGATSAVTELHLGSDALPQYYTDMEFVGAACIKGTAWTAAEISDIADALITANGGTP